MKKKKLQIGDVVGLGLNFENNEVFFILKDEIKKISVS